jgi:hypothetical protein
VAEIIATDVKPSMAYDDQCAIVEIFSQPLCRDVTHFIGTPNSVKYGSMRE